MNYLVTFTLSVMVCSIKIYIDYTLLDRGKKSYKLFSIIYEFGLLSLILYFLYPKGADQDLIIIHYINLVIVYWFTYEWGMNKVRGYHWAKLPPTFSKCTTISETFAKHTNFRKYELVLFKFITYSLTLYIYLKLNGNV